MLEPLPNMPKILDSILITEKKQLSLSGMMLHPCNFSIGEEEADRSGVQGQPGLHETVFQTKQQNPEHWKSY